MSDAKEEAKRQAREMAEERGYHIPVFDWLVDYDPEFEVARMNYARELFTPTREHHLPVKYREMAVALILAYKQIASTKAHLKRALDEGATMEELIEAFQVVGLPGGFPTMSFGLEQLRQLDMERQGKPID